MWVEGSFPHASQKSEFSSHDSLSLSVASGSCTSWTSLGFSEKICLLPIILCQSRNLSVLKSSEKLFWKVSDFPYTSFQSFQKAKEKNRQFLLTLFVLSLAFTLFSLHFTPMLYFIRVSERSWRKGMPLAAQLLPQADLFLFWISRFLPVNLSNFCNFNFSNIITT